MKLNFWQWLGIIFVIVAVVLFARRKIGSSDTVTTLPSSPNTVAPTTSPANR